LPAETRVASVQIYDYVQALQYGDAHRLAAVLLVFSFAVLLLVYARPRNRETLL
jgi:molybdate transport system permease protein